jgi:drug/metabolite transporter (DMT)-like permease
VILGLAVALLWGTGDLLAAFAARHMGAFRTLGIAQVTELVLCLGWFVLRPTPVAGDIAVGILLMAGVLTAGSYGALYRGLMLGPIMLVAPIAAAYAIGPTVLAVVLLDERLSLGGAMGALAAISGVVVLSASHAGRDARDARGRGGGVPFGLAAMVGFAISAFMIAASAQRSGALPTLLISRVGATAMLVIVALGPARRRLMASRHHTAPFPAGLAALAGVSNIFGTALYAHAGELGIVALVTPVSALFPLVPIVGGYILFRERPDLIQIVGIGMIIGGLVLLG